MDREQRSASWYSQMFECTSSAIFVYTLDGELVDINPAACALHGWTREEMLGRRPSDFIAPGSMEVFDAFRSALSRGEEYRGQAQGLRADGSIFDVEVYGVAIELDGEVFAFSSLTDISETLRLREKLEEAQRMDALGRLAGGIAHDFNNMLMVIMGSAEYGRATSDPGLIELAFTDILNAAERARELTVQLMAFSRDRAIRREQVDVGLLIRGSLPLLTRLLPENIVFEADIEDVPLPIDGEPAPLEQVVVNLVLNARDALRGRSGHIRLCARRRIVDEFTVAELPAGTYVELTVEDDGVGMSKATMAHIFEPFFTTKKDSAGTGLGLASAYGTVRQHGGCILVYSELGCGSSFRVYLPLTDAELVPTPDNETVEPEHDPLQGLAVVVIDDEPTIRDLVVKTLERLGATAVAGSTEAAEALVQATNARLLISDVIMPGIDGPSLFRRLRGSFGELRVLYISGYSADHLSRGELLDSGVEVLAKPFTMRELATAVRRALR